MAVPNLQTLLLGVVFVSLGACRYLLIKFSANPDGTYSYLPVTVNVCAEFVKLAVCGVLSAVVLCKDKSSCECPQRVDQASVWNQLKWAVPGFLYFLDNLLQFYVIKYLQPAVVVLLGNFVIISTSVLFRVILKRVISRVQWASLVILFLAIVALSNSSSVTVDHHKHHAVNHLIPKATNSSHAQCSPASGHFSQSQNSSATNVDNELEAPSRFQFNEGHVLILIQCLLSSLANIYNEKILKEGNGLQESIYIQNSKLYIFGVIFNLLSLVIHSHYRERLLHCGFFHGHNRFSIALMFATAFYGLTVALILKFRDNMFYLLSSQLITVTVIAASVYFFDFDPNLNFFLMAPIVVCCIYIFNKGKSPTTKAPSPDHVRYRLLEEEEKFISPDNLQE